MFAGAVREMVFSDPVVIKKVNSGYVRLALSASLVNSVGTARDPEEGKFYQRIKASMPAPQGVGVINSGGEVLDWVLTFESQAACHEFFDYGIARFRAQPGLDRAVSTRRYQPYPGGKREDFENPKRTDPVADRHPDGVVCPATAAAKSRARKGDVAVEIFGRVVDKEGNPREGSVNQEDYSQDHFLITSPMQGKLERALSAGKDRVRMPDDLAKQIITYAYLSHMDVRPLENPRGGKGEIRTNEFWLRKANAPGWWEVEGTSDVSGGLQGDGGHEHSVRLDWTGYVRMKDDGIERIILGARGTERLKFGQRRGRPNRDLELQSLPGGRAIDLDGPVRYGVIGTAVERDQVRAGETGKGNPQKGGGPGGPPASLRRKMQRLGALMGNTPPDNDFRASMRRFQQHARKGEFDAAEKILDRLLEAHDRR